MKNILYLSPSHLPSQSANSVHVMKMCSALSKIGFRVHLFGYLKQNSNIFEYYNVNKDFEVYGYIQSGRLRKIRNILSLLNFIKKNQITAIYSRRLDISLFLAVFNPITVELHSPEIQHKRIFKVLLFFKRISKLVVISNALKSILIERGIVTRNYNSIIVAHDGVDASQFMGIIPRRFNDIKNKSVMLGYVGSLYQGRGIDVLLSIAKLLPQHRFLIVGGDPQSVLMYEYNCSELGIKNCFFTGHIPQARLAEQYSLMDILLMPYQDKVAVSGDEGDSSRWMSPLKLFEYFCVKRPIISSDLEVLREVLSDGFNAKLVSSYWDPQAWIQAIHEVLSDQELFNQLASNPLTTLHENTWDSRVEYLLSKEAL